MPIPSLLAAALLANAGAHAAPSALVAPTLAAPAQDTTVKVEKQPKAPSKNRDVISAEELARPEVRTMTVLEAIKRLRPSYLNKRGATSFGSVGDPNAGLPRASIDWRPLTALDDLASMPLDSVKEIRFLDPAKATQRFGTGAGATAVIVVITM